MAHGRNRADALEIAGAVLRHFGTHWRVIARIGIYWFLTLWITLCGLAVLSRPATPVTPVTAAIAIVLIFAILMCVWLAPPYVVRCHCLVLSGAERALARSAWRWGPTEWRLIRMGFLVSALSLATAAVMLILTALVASLFDEERNILVPLGFTIGLLAALFVGGLSILFAPIVVAGGANPIYTSVEVLWRRRGLWLILYPGVFLTILAAELLDRLPDLLFSSTSWATAYLLIAATINAVLVVVIGALGPIVLSCIYLQVRGDIPPEAPTEDESAIA